MKGILYLILLSFSFCFLEATPLSLGDSLTIARGNASLTEPSLSLEQTVIVSSNNSDLVTYEYSTPGLLQLNINPTNGLVNLTWGGSFSSAGFGGSVLGIVFFASGKVVTGSLVSTTTSVTNASVHNLASGAVFFNFVDDPSLTNGDNYVLSLDLTDAPLPPPSPAVPEPSTLILIPIALFSWMVFSRKK